MRLPKARVGTAGLGQIVLVFLIERTKRRLRRRRHIARKVLHDHRHHFHCGLLLEPTEVVPLPARRISIEGGLVEHQHRASGQFRPQRLEEVALRQGERSKPEFGEDLVKLLLPNQIAGPLPEEIVDALVAHDDAVGFGILGEQGCLHGLLFPLGQQRHAGWIAATGGRRFHQEPVHERPHGDGSLESALAEFASVPGDGHGILRRGGAAHLQERRQHEKREHCEDCHKYEQGTLVFAKNFKRADHGTACELFSDGRTAEA